MKDEQQLELFNDDIRDKDISTIDRLFLEVKQYRKCSEFKKKLEFYASFPYLGAYNAALVEQQRPGARFVLTAKKWEELYDRKIKPTARPVIILIPFYPVDFLFDIMDTKPKDKNKWTNDRQVIERIISSHMANNTRDTFFYLDNMERNLPKQGICFNSRYIVGSEIYAEIREDQTEDISVMLNKNTAISHHSYFTISVNAHADWAETLALMFHELGHLFCQHFNCKWWKGRSLTKEVEEFEAETVSYLVCRRLGLHSHSVEKLADYMEEYDVIPPISIDYVLRAVDLTEQMVRGNMDITKGLLYKKDKSFKQKVDVEKERIKKEKEQEKRSRETKTPRY